MDMKWVTINYYDPRLEEWRGITIPPSQLKKELAWKMYLGYQCFRIINH